MNYPEWINPVAVSIGGIKVYWYGIMYLLGMVAFQLVANYRITTGRYKGFMTSDDISNFVFYIMMGVILGGRLGYVLFYGTALQWQNDPLWGLKIWQGGMSFHGGMLGVFFAIWLFNRKILRGAGYHVMDLYEFTAPLICIGLGLGRIGNFIGRELYGRPTDMPWGIIFHSGDYARHPSQLYQAFLEGVILFTILYVFSLKARRRFEIAGLFMIGYGAFRILVEFFREPDSQMGYYLDYFTMGQILSLPMVLFGIWCFWYARKKDEYLVIKEVRETKETKKKEKKRGKNEK